MSNGPAIVVTSEGRTVWYRWHGIMRKTATNRLLKYYDDKNESIEQNEDANDIDHDKIEVIENTTENIPIEDIIENNPIEDIIKINPIEDTTGFLYSCDQCEYKSNHKNKLKSHVDTIHEEFLYSCDQCEYKSNKKEVLINHNKSIHKNIEVSVDKKLKSSLRKKAAKDIRPAFRENVKIKLFEEDFWRTGRVNRVGKSSGKFKNTCWISQEDGTEKMINFITDVENRKYVRGGWKVKFSEDLLAIDLNETLSNDDVNNTYVTELTQDKNGASELKIHKVFATLVPVARHNEPEIIDAKETELENWRKYQAFEIVDDKGQDRITTRWVINQKECHDGLKTEFKARLCLRGFQETTVPRSDSPTASRDTTKLALAIAANEKWKAECLDVTAAFLQGSPLERVVYVEPPPEDKVEGEIWLLNKAGYGLYDGARLWYLEVIKTFEELGMNQLTGDEATYHYRVNNELQGIIVLHVDDFLVLGSDLF